MQGWLDVVMRQDTALAAVCTTLPQLGPWAPQETGPGADTVGISVFNCAIVEKSCPENPSRVGAFAVRFWQFMMHRSSGLQPPNRTMRPQYYS